MPAKPSAKAKAVKAPYCPYCHRSARLLAHGQSGYPYASDYGVVWICVEDQAWVGCHRDQPQPQPLGRLANAALRKAKIAAHAVFDPLWQGDTAAMKRRDAYQWLSDAMKADRLVHIGWMDEDECQQVITLCAARRDGASTASESFPSSATPA